LFFLLAFYALARTADSPRPGAWAAAVVAAHFLCVASKETAVAAPPLLLLFDWLFIAGSWRAALARRRWMYAGLVVNWVVLAALVLSSGGRAGTAGFGSRASCAPGTAASRRAWIWSRGSK